MTCKYWKTSITTMELDTVLIFSYYPRWKGKKKTRVSCIFELLNLHRLFILLQSISPTVTKRIGMKGREQASWGRSVWAGPGDRAAAADHGSNAPDFHTSTISSPGFKSECLSSRRERALICPLIKPPTSHSENNDFPPLISPCFRLISELTGKRKPTGIVFPECFGRGEALSSARLESEGGEREESSKKEKKNSKCRWLGQSKAAYDIHAYWTEWQGTLLTPTRGSDLLLVICPKEST